MGANIPNEDKYQIFISSTYKDLKKERRQVIKEVLRAEQFPVAMENFVASNTEQWGIIERYLKGSGCLILIIGKSRGSIDKSDPDKRSFTEKEFDFAVENNIPILAFISRRIKPRHKSYRFKTKVEQSKRLVDYFSNLTELSSGVVHAISKEKQHFINPWKCSPENREYNRDVANLPSLKNANYWNTDAEDMYNKYKDDLDRLKVECLNPMEWKGGRDFNSLFEIRDDDNMISKERRTRGISKSVRYVYTETTGKMMVLTWFL